VISLSPCVEYIGDFSVKGLFRSLLLISTLYSQFVQLVRYVGFIAVSDPLLCACAIRCFLKLSNLYFTANYIFEGMWFQIPFY
jgi:hypothetical protein